MTLAEGMAGATPCSDQALPDFLSEYGVPLDSGRFDFYRLLYDLVN